MDLGQVQPSLEPTGSGWSLEGIPLLDLMPAVGVSLEYNEIELHMIKSIVNLGSYHPKYR